MPNIILENNRIKMTLFSLKDYSHLLPFSENEPELWRYSLKSAAGKDRLLPYIYESIEEYRAKTTMPFIVFDKEKNAFAGSTRLYKINLETQTAMLGYTWFGKAFQGTGINRNSKFLLLQHAFENMGLERIEFRADVRNARSIAALRSIGASIEGTLRGDCLAADGTRRNSVVLSILKSEWHEGVKNRLLLDCMQVHGQHSNG